MIGCLFHGKVAEVDHNLQNWLDCRLLRQLEDNLKLLRVIWGLMGFIWDKQGSLWVTDGLI